MVTSTNGWYLPNHVKFYLALILQIPSIILCLLIFTFFILNPTVLRKLRYKALLPLLIVNFLQLTLDLPMATNYYRLDRVSPATSTYCKWWLFIESTLEIENQYLAAAISIQRHILVFQPNILNVRRTRYLLYYLPLLLCVIYPIIFYMSAVLFYPCDDTQWDFTENVCGNTACYLSGNDILATFDWIVNGTLPTIVIILANIVLVIRVIKQKNRRQQMITWSKQRRMTLQLLSISSVYLFVWFPSIVTGVMDQFYNSDVLSEIEADYIGDLTYVVCIFVPWICIGLLPEFMKWILKQFRRLKRQWNMVRPI